MPVKSRFQQKILYNSFVGVWPAYIPNPLPVPTPPWLRLWALGCDWLCFTTICRSDVLSDARLDSPSPSPGKSMQMLNGAEKGDPAAMLLSPRSLPPMPTGDSSWHANGSLFTLFLTAPIQALCLLLGFSGSDVQVDAYEKVNRLLSSSLSDWGLTLASSGILDPVWSQVFCDPFLRRILLRFIFCWAVLTLYAPTQKKPEFIPQCLPSLPESVHPSAPAIQSTILQIADALDAASSFNFSEVTAPRERRDVVQEQSTD